MDRDERIVDFDERLRRFEAEWQDGRTPQLESFLYDAEDPDAPDDPDGSSLFARLLDCELERRRRRGETPQIEEYVRRFPRARSTIRRRFEATKSWRREQDATETWSGRSTDAPDRLPDLPGYEILQPLGRGGMGFVVQARDLALGRLVAIKLPLPEKLRDAQDRERFVREARAAARLRHPGICPIYEIGEAQGLPFLALAYIDGQVLTDWAAAQRPDARRSAQIAAEVAEAVQAAHDAGVVHRDLKPANVMIERAGGRAVLMDFGLAKDAAGPDVQLTFDGAVLGTPAFMAPEQAAGRIDRIGPATDVYGLGALLYWLLARRPPFAGPFADVLRQVQSSEPPPLLDAHPGLHRDLETICRKAMAKEPRDRYRSARDLADDLSRFARGEAIVARPDGPARRIWRAVRRRPAWTAALLAALLLPVVAVPLALQTVRARRVLAAQRGFQQALENDAWTIDRYRRLEADAARFQSLDPELAAQAAASLRRRYQEHLRRAIDSPSLDAEALDRLRTAIDFFAGVDPAASGLLRGELDKRLRAWRPLFELRPPFTGWTDQFAAEQWTVAADRLDAAPLDTPPADAPTPPDRPAAPDAPTAEALADLRTANAACEGDVELQAVFPEVQWLPASRLGVALNATHRGEGYQFVLAVASRPAAASSSGLESPLDAPAAPGDSTPGPAGSTTPPPSTPPPSTPIDGERPGGDARPSASAVRTSPSFAEALRDGLPIELQIVRNGQVVRRQTVQLGGGPLEMTAQRVGGRLAFHVNRRPPLVFDDIFPLGGADPGRFGLIVPPGVGVARVQAARRALPEAPSPLEEGDFLASDRRYEAALERYRAQENQADEQVRQESRVKQGLCLLQLGRHDEGAALLESISGETGDRWPIVAAGHLWMLRLQQRRYDDAELIRELLASRYEFEQLALLLPDRFRQGVIKEYLTAVRGANLAGFSDSQLARIERVVATERLVGGDVSPMTQLLLLRAYRAAGRNDRARQTAAALLGSPGEASLLQVDRLWLAEEYSWLLRSEGQAAAALEFVDARLAADPGAAARPWAPLLVERARILAALDRPDDALRDLERLFEQVDPGEMLYRHYSAARLLQGFLLDDAGDSPGALAAWRAGLYRQWRPHHARRFERTGPQYENDALRPPLPAENPHQFSGAEFVQFAMLASLAGELSEAEAQRMFGWLMFRWGAEADSSPVVALVSLLQKDLVLRTFQGLCSTPRGRRIARNIALQTVDLDEYVLEPVCLVAYEVAHQGAFPDGFDDDQDAVVWEAARSAYAAYSGGQVSKPQMIALAFTWRGQTGALGWDGVAAGLAPPLRASLAYLFGRRLLRLKQPHDAAKLFQTAAADATDDRLRTQAAAELQRLNSPPAPP